MKRLLLTLLLFTSIQSFAQQNINIDSLVNKMCITFRMEKFASDSVTLLNPLVKHLSVYTTLLDADHLDSLYATIMYRMQFSCPEYNLLGSKALRNNGDWQHVKTVPISKISKEDCNAFFKIQHFGYLSTNGDTVKVTIKDSTWQDNFNDGTISRLSFLRTSYNEFEITFIESNNLTRKSAFKLGDKFPYTLIEKHEKYYLVYIELPKIEYRTTFKMYPLQ